MLLFERETWNLLSDVIVEVTWRTSAGSRWSQSRRLVSTLGCLERAPVSHWQCGTNRSPRWRTALWWRPMQNPPRRTTTMLPSLASVDKMASIRRAVVVLWQSERLSRNPQARLWNTLERDHCSCSPTRTLSEEWLYRSLIGSILYLRVWVAGDLVLAYLYSVHLARFWSRIALEGRHWSLPDDSRHFPWISSL